MSADPIRARLDRYISPETGEWLALNYRDALRAVLAVRNVPCVDPDDPDQYDQGLDDGYQMALTDIRRVIAEHLGVTDDLG